MKDITPDDLLLLMIADKHMRECVATTINTCGGMNPSALNLNTLVFALGVAVGVKAAAPALLAKLPSKVADGSLAKIIEAVKGQTP